MHIKPHLVSLRPITADTVRAVCALSVAVHQVRFVAPNAVSLAEALFSPRAWYRAIFLDEQIVGFVMLYDPSLGPVPDVDDDAVVWRFMVDERSQRKGVGRAALLQIVEHARLKGFGSLLLSYVEGNAEAEAFYVGLGFEHTGHIEDGEVQLKLRLG